MKVYEIGSFEKYEEGFHAFARTLDKEKAHFIHVKASNCLKNIPKIDLTISDSEMEKHIQECESVDFCFKQETGLSFNVSSISGGLYEIQIREYDLI